MKLAPKLVARLKFSSQVHQLTGGWAGVGSHAAFRLQSPLTSGAKHRSKSSRPEDQLGSQPISDLLHLCKQSVVRSGGENQGSRRDRRRLESFTEVWRVEHLVQNERRDEVAAAVIGYVAVGPPIQSVRLRKCMAMRLMDDWAAVLCSDAAETTFDLLPALAAQLNVYEPSKKHKHNKILFVMTWSCQLFPSSEKNVVFLFSIFFF